MKILVISDQPKRKSFIRILKLKDLLQNKVQKKVDLLVFSQELLFFNSQKGKKMMKLKYIQDWTFYCRDLIILCMWSH